MHEFQIIKNFFSKLTKKNDYSLKLNDDVFFDKTKQLIISVDTYVEGTHFVNFAKPDLVIKKIIRSSISDLVCKGVYPKYYFLSGSGDKKTFSLKNLKKITKSLKEEQKKFGISLSGGDTVFSKKLSFTVISLGFSKKIIYRNKAKINDDIYVTGNVGDSYTGLLVLRKKINISKRQGKYFEAKYFSPEIPIKLIRKLFEFANTSIDISDGLVADLERLINKQKLSYKINLTDIPISNKLQNLINLKKLKKVSFISKGDDYQILFTANPFKKRIISKTAKSLGIKITRIGKILPKSEKSQIIDENEEKITIKTKGYAHKF